MAKVWEERYKYEEDTYLTVMKTTLFFSGDGFSVYDSETRLLFRVDSYGGPDTSSQRQIFLMAPDGRSLLTLRRKWPSLHHRWEGYAGEFKDGSKPAFSVRLSSMMSSSGSVTVEMNDSAREEYEIEGCFAKRSCTVYAAATRSVVAEIRRKVDASVQMVLGKDVFVLCVKAGFDGAFAMALVLVLDQICAADQEGAQDDALEVPEREPPLCEVPAAVNFTTENQNVV